MGVGPGAIDGSMPITARASSNVTPGVHIVARSGSCSGHVSLGFVTLVACAGSDRGWRDRRVGVGNN